MSTERAVDRTQHDISHNQEIISYQSEVSGCLHKIIFNRKCFNHFCNGSLIKL